MNTAEDKEGPAKARLRGTRSILGALGASESCERGRNRGSSVIERPCGG